MRIVTGSTFALACVLAAGSVHAQVGDLCEDSIPVAEGSFPFDNSGMTTQMQVDCAASNKDIWFIYTPTSSGYATIDTCGSSFDTVLAVVLDCFVDTNCNDDACGLQSAIAGVPVFEGISIGIRIAAYGTTGAGGSGVLNINITPPAQWDEQVNGQADAGQELNSAQVPTGSGPFTSISGGFDWIGDCDIYQINVCDVANFSATTALNTDPFFDTRLFLFDSTGAGVTYNDDVPAGTPGDDTLLSHITGAFVPATGNYYLAVTQFDDMALDGMGSAMWAETPFNTERAPDGPGSAGPLASWRGGGEDLGTYRIDMTGACFPGGGGPTCDPDVNQDGNVDQDDVSYLINVVGGGDNPTGIDPDFNQDGNVDQDDIAALINTVGGGGCP
ncbi:MAG: DVUA0089 family protein [Phycisphaerales bacterium]|nr:DVUA0089 family protein [Phycisphaerales bacterium]